MFHSRVKIPEERNNQETQIQTSIVRKPEATNMKPHQSNRSYAKRPRTNVCYNCGQEGHIASQCNGETQDRMQICWTCGQDDHIRTSRKCPGNPAPENWFCSFCKTQGISTELCDCNDVSTSKLRSTRAVKRNRNCWPNKSGNETLMKPEILEKSNEKTLQNKLNFSRLVIKVNTPKIRMPSYEWLWAIKVGIDGNNYIAQISPGRKSFINPERVQTDKIVDIPTTIFNRTKKICYTRDTTIPTPVVLGEDAVIIFGIRAFIEEDQTLPFAAEENPESESDQETIKKPHPNRRLESDK